MLQTHLRTYLTKLLTPPDRFQELRTIWILCLLNVGLIVLLGGLMMSLSGHYVFFLLTLLMMGSAGSMIFFLLIRLAHLTLVATKQHLDSVAYEKTDTPLLILTPDLHLAHSNKKARENCWWASHLTVLRNVLMDGESQVALERLVEGLHKKQEAIETLYLRGKKGKETWKIHATPMGKHALWQCHNITQEKNQNAAYISQLNTMTLMMDHAPEAIFSLNKKGTILFCNQKFAQYLGYERHKLIGAPFSKFLAKPRTMDPLQPFEIQGKCELVTASSRIKTVFLEQTQISHDNGSVT
jgi:PAS domain-containing protein